jgi:outer membrane protein assembly factor BamC
MKGKIGSLSLIAFALAGCSSVNTTRQAQGDFDYVNKAEGKPLVVPAPLKKPNFGHQYDISNQINHEGAVGEKLDVRAPSLVLPVAAGARVDMQDKSAMIWFDQVVESKPIVPFVRHAIEQELNDKQSAIVKSDERTMETDWVVYKEEQGYWWWKKEVIKDKKKFLFTLTPKSHGRSVGLSVELIDFQGDEPLDPIDKQRAEVTLLNDVIGQVDYQYRLFQKERKELRANQQLVTIGSDNKEQPAYLVEMSLDDLWSNLPVFFERFGFTIKDLDESKKIYFVEYKKPESSFWDSIWGDEKPVIDLPNGNYQFRLNAADDELTSVTISDDKAVLSAETLSHIFTVIEPGLSFRTVE